MNKLTFYYSIFIIFLLLNPFKSQAQHTTPCVSPPIDTSTQSNSPQSASSEQVMLWEVGQTISVRFLQGGSTELRNKIMGFAKEWELYANVKFLFVSSGQSDIRISFKNGVGSYSYVGTYALRIPSQEETMNFDFTSSHSEEFIDGVIRHEFGHALGLWHEHQNPLNNINWDKEAVYEHNNHLSMEEVDNLYFTKLTEQEIYFCDYDPASIMHYPVPNEFTLDNFTVPYNSTLSIEDTRFIAALYPFSGTRNPLDCGFCNNPTCGTTTYPINMTITGGRGNIFVETPMESRFTCASTCTKAYQEGQTIRLQAIPEEGYQFTRWLGDICNGSTSTSCSFSINNPIDISAVFEPIPQPNIQLSIEVQGEGRVRYYKDGVEQAYCERSCEFNYREPNFNVQLVAEAKAGYEFDNWEGDVCVNSQQPICDFTLSHIRTARAIFKPIANPTCTGLEFEEHTIPVPSIAWGFNFCTAIGDLDGDGDNDIVRGGRAVGTGDKPYNFSWLRNEGNGSFQEIILFEESNSRLTAVEIQDIDKDGDADIIVTFDVENKFSIFEQVAVGQFIERIIDMDFRFEDMDIADMDNDRDLDIIVASRLTGRLSWFRNDGNLNFQEIIISTNIVGVFDIYVEDINEDGFKDVVLSRRRPYSEVSIFFNEQIGFRKQVIASMNSPFKVIAGHYDEDNLIDIMTISIDSFYYDEVQGYESFLYRLYLLKNLGNDQFEQKAILTTVGPEAFVYDLANFPNSNVNKDDIVLVYNGNGTPQSSRIELLTYEDGNFSQTILDANTRSDRCPIIVDLDKDGLLDIVASSENGSGISWFRKICEEEVSSNTCRSRDSLSLVALYNATAGRNWINTWDLAQPITAWYGVGLNKEGCVAYLDLDGVVSFGRAHIGSGNGLNGTLPDELWDLEELEQLAIADGEIGNIRGRIDEKLLKLTKLRILQIEGYQARLIEGYLPNNIDKLKKLEMLVLVNNNLSGSLPLSLGNLSNLVGLHLGGNRFTGTIPYTLGNMENLSSLTLSSNNLSGCFPRELKNLCGKNISFFNNPNLPNRGDFYAFCNYNQACSNLQNPQNETTSSRLQISTNSLINPNQEQVLQNYPNPFSGITTLPLTLAENTIVKVELFSVTGKRIYQENFDLEAGANKIELAGSLFPKSGIYFYRVYTKNQMFSGKMSKF